MTTTQRWIFVISLLCSIIAIGLFFAPEAGATPLENKPESTQEMVTRIAKSYGNDPDLALAIMSCESLNSQESIGKNYINGEHWSSDIGLYQINNYYHLKTAQKMGLDLYVEEDNVVYAMWLMQHQGSRPWIASKSCWSKLV